MKIEDIAKDMYEAEDRERKRQGKKSIDREAWTQLSPKNKNIYRAMVVSVLACITDDMKKWH